MGHNTNGAHHYGTNQSFRFAGRRSAPYTSTMRLPERINAPVQNDPNDGPGGPIYLSDSNSLWDQLRGQTTEHADPPRLEDEGQSGG